MPSLGGIAKYLSLLSIGKGFIDKAVLQKLLTGLAAVVAISAAVGLLAGAIIIALFVGLYYTLLTNGFSQPEALLTIGVTISLIIGLLVYRVIRLIRKISAYSSVFVPTSSPISPITDIVNAFMSGFNEPAADKKSKAKPFKAWVNRRL